MKRFFSFLGFLIGIVGATAGAFTDFPTLFEELGIPTEWTNPTRVVILTVSLMIIVYKLYEYVHEIKLFARIFNSKSAFFQYLHNWFCNKKKYNLMQLQVDMHNRLINLRANIDEIKENIKQIEKLTPLDRVFFFKDFFYRIMKSVSVAFHDIFHHSITIGIHFLTEEGENTFLYSWLTFHEIETESSNDNHLHDEKYIIHSCRRKKELKDFALNAKNYYNQHDDEGYMKNSIFDYILTTPHNSWISNNVNEDFKKGELYISGSSNNDEYPYKSLAVYAIAPPIAGKRKNVKTMGLLTFESSAANAFAKKESTIVLQSFYQTVYDALNEIQK